MQPLLNTAFLAARQAAKVIVRQLDRLDTLKVSEKQQHDFVSNIDMQAEEIIIEALRQAYPSHGILTEESGMIEQNEENLWIIDPLDGTQNYLRGIPHFSISIAMQHKGHLEHALVYDPLREELFCASRGDGAKLNDRRIRVSKAQTLGQSLLATGFPFRQRDVLPQYLKGFSNIYEQVIDVRRTGSAALDLAYVAAGRVDGFWEFGLKPWDIAAGALLVTEAGGYINDFAGKGDYLHNGNVLAATPKIFSPLQELITQHT